MALTFTGRVAIVTGAGGGLGRAYALLLASRGCAVLVNDLGVATSGEGGDQRPADRVVAEIRAAGGTAAANYDSATDGPALVAAAISTFGGVHIVICNAGILRDKSFQKMTDAEWDALYKVHLFAAFSLARAAWGRFKDQGFGRIIFVGSAAGLYGNVGQANYSAFKLALVGLAHTLAIEGGKKGIQTNVVVPIAGSRMTETVLPADLVEVRRPHVRRCCARTLVSSRRRPSSRRTSRPSWRGSATTPARTTTASTKSARAGRGSCGGSGQRGRLWAAQLRPGRRRGPG